MPGTATTSRRGESAGSPLRLPGPPVDDDGPSTSTRSRWTIAGRTFLVMAWTAEDYAALPVLDRAILRASAARRLADGSWHLLMLAS